MDSLLEADHVTRKLELYAIEISVKLTIMEARLHACLALLELPVCVHDLVRLDTVVV